MQSTPTLPHPTPIAGHRLLGNFEFFSPLDRLPGISWDRPLAECGNRTLPGLQQHRTLVRRGMQNRDIKFT
jgi:hypothetical protein